MVLLSLKQADQSVLHWTTDGSSGSEVTGLLCCPGFNSSLQHNLSFIPRVLGKISGPGHWGQLSQQHHKPIGGEQSYRLYN